MDIESTDYMGDAQVIQIVTKGKSHDPASWRLEMKDAAIACAERELGVRPPHAAVLTTDEYADGYIILVAVWGDL